MQYNYTKILKSQLTIWSCFMITCSKLQNCKQLNQTAKDSVIFYWSNSLKLKHLFFNLILSEQTPISFLNFFNNSRQLLHCRMVRHCNDTFFYKLAKIVKLYLNVVTSSIEHRIVRQLDVENYSHSRELCHRLVQSKLL